MDENMEYIEQFFDGELSDSEKERFEELCQTDKVFAKDVAHYIKTKYAFKEQLRAQRKAEFEALHQAPSKKLSVFKTLTIPALAAAAIVLIVLSFWFFYPSTSTQNLADNYIKEHFTTLSSTMGSEGDSLQYGIQLYNEGNLKKALQVFNSQLVKDSTDSMAKKYAGIVYLRLGDYDKCVNLFDELAKQKHLHINPATFYKAIALLKRNRTGDLPEAKRLLVQVVSEDLYGNKEAAVILKSL